jgi:hypothetical protein
MALRGEQNVARANVADLEEKLAKVETVTEPAQK